MGVCQGGLATSSRTSMGWTCWLFIVASVPKKIAMDHPQVFYYIYNFFLFLFFVMFLVFGLSACELVLRFSRSTKCIFQILLYFVPSNIRLITQNLVCRNATEAVMFCRKLMSISAINKSPNPSHPHTRTHNETIELSNNVHEAD